MPETSPASPFKLLIAGIRWPPETFLARLVEGLLQAGVQVTVATANRPGAELRRKAGFNWLPVPAWEGAYPLRLLRLAWQLGRGWVASPSNMGMIGRQVQQGGRLNERLRLWQRWSPYAGKRWDVIYFPWNSGAIEHLALFDLSMPVVISCRGAQVNVAPYHPQRSDLQQGLRETFSRAARVHCVSQAILEEASLFGLDKEKTAVVRPAVDVNFFYPLNQPAPANKPFTVVSTGSLIWRKGYEYALLAMRRLKDAGIPLRYQVIGQGPEEQRLRYTIHDLGLEPQVELLGRQPPEVVRAKLQQADAFLLSSLSEGIANAILEAMACGIPVVTTDCGGLREAVSDGVEGFVVPLRQPEAMAQALHKLWQDPALRRRMGERGRARVWADFNLDKQIPQFLALFQQALRSGEKTS